MPRSVVPDEQQNLLAHLFELLQAPLEKLSRYGRNRSSVYEAHPHVGDLGQVESVAAYGLRLGIIFCDRPLDEAQRVALLAPGVECGKRQAAPPAFVLEADGPGAGVLGGHFHQSVAPPFFRSYRGSGEVIHRLARIQRTPSRRESVVRIVSPETRSSVSPFSKGASAAIPRVHRLVSYPNSLGERWSMPRNFSALFSSKASRVRLGREDLAWRARRPLRLKSWMASRTFWDNGRTKIGVFMDGIITRQPKPILKMH